MPIKIFAALVAVVLVLGFLSPVVFKLKQVALAAIVLIGIVMMLVDLWNSLHREDD
jgi:predicted ABC-type exoprotein transport system permease subunit